MQISHSLPSSNWIVLTTQPHREDLAMENLIRQDFHPYCPMIVKRIKHARRAYDAKRPLFPGYIFVEYQARQQLWRPLLGTFGVRSVLRNGEVPALLPSGFVESLKVREIDGAIHKPVRPFEPGQAVVINGGPFDGLVGQILEIREADRVVLLLNLLNQETKVRVETKMLRSA